MKIVFLDASTISLKDDTDYSSIRALGELVCHPFSVEDDVIERCRDAHTIIANKVEVSEKSIRNLPDLKHIAVIATGYNNVDLKAAAQANIRVTNVRGYAKYTVPQHTFALILNLATRIHDYCQDVKAGEWQKSNFFNLLNYPTFELFGKSIGIIGFGVIGKGVASIAQGFGMHILYHDPYCEADAKHKACGFDDLLATSDIVSLHCPLTSKNKHIINADALKKMKSSAFLINTARGDLVDEPALLNALVQGEIAGAGLDVLSQEPPKENPLLANIKNLIVTPHCAWTAIEARQRLIDEVAKNIKAFIEGRDRNVVSAVV